MNRSFHRVLVVACVACVLLSKPAAAQSLDSAAAAARARQIAGIVDGAIPALDTIFSPAFLQQVPPAQLLALTKQLASLGHIRRVASAGRAPDGPGLFIFRFETEGGNTIPATLAVEPAAPHLVAGLVFGNPIVAARGTDDVLRELAGLPGHVSVAVARVEGSRLIPIAALDTTRILGIGSSFKLYVLAELVRQIENGKRHWADVLVLDSASRSLPSGILQTWPVGTPMTLQALATLMISQSDNTAADHLLHLLGREQVERIQSVAGSTSAARNAPFLSTRELFALKVAGNASTKAAYIAGDEGARRAILTSPGIVGRQRSGPDFAGGPNAIESIEWFASTMDLARAMVWLRDHTADASTASARDVLSVNKAIEWPPATWRYVGFKGGSEPGVINLTFLAQRVDGPWFTLSASWNDPQHTVDEARFVALVTSLRNATMMR